MDVLPRQAGDGSNRPVGAGRHLGRCDDVRRGFPDVRTAVLRFHRRMVDKRNQVARADHFVRALHGLAEITIVSNDLAIAGQ